MAPVMSSLACSPAERGGEGQEPAWGLSTAEPGLLGPFAIGTQRPGAGQCYMATKYTCPLNLWVAVASGKREGAAALCLTVVQAGSLLCLLTAALSLLLPSQCFPLSFPLSLGAQKGSWEHILLQPVSESPCAPPGQAWCFF